MKDQAILIIGATSGIAQAVAAQAAEAGARLHLVARNADELTRLAQDLRVRYGATVTTGHGEAEDYGSHPTVLEETLDALGRLDGVFLAMGMLGDQEEAQRNFTQAQQIIAVNYTGVVSLLTPIANHLEEQGSGFIAAIASVAGDRGRQSNYLYGSAKGALALFLQGLRNRLAGKGVHVLTIKPGFVDTKMTYGKEGLFLVASPEKVARDVLKAVRKRCNVVYTPWFWAWIMRLIRAVPERIFKKLSL